MKSLTLIFVVTFIFIISVSGYLIKVPTIPDVPPEEASQPQRTSVQKLIIPLFENVCEISIDPTIQRLAQDFTIDPNDYLSPTILQKFEEYKSSGLLPKGTIFTESNPKHLNELKIIFEILYSANNFDTFYKTAAWGRQNLNCVSYVNAIYLAILNRKDTQDILIPAPYELLPNYFINKDVILQAVSILNGDKVTLNESVRFMGNSYIIDANYTAMFYDNEDDSKLAYFREDIGLNSYYFLRKLRMAPWMNNNVNRNFGENMYHIMKQFMARYDLERYANGLPEVDSINLNSPIDEPYDPLLIYSNGNEFSHRTLPLDLPNNEDILLLQALENNVLHFVNQLQQSGYNKTHILNHLMEIFVTRDRSYETLARQYLGKDLTNNGYASVLEHYLTSLRDPIFWQINKRIIELVDEALKILPPYTRHELYLPGVEIVNIDVKKIMTSYDFFEFGVLDALKTEDHNSTFKVKIGQPRLNHKKFTIKVNVSSIVPQKGIMKIYLGPNLMPDELLEKKNLFTLLDVSEINLKPGTNIISRSSDDMKQFSDDFIPLNAIKKMVDDTEFGIDSFPSRTIQSQIGYPSRLILPKGTPQGLPLQMFVFIAPYFKKSVSDIIFQNKVEFNTAVLSPGYPFDLMIEDREFFGLPNGMIKTVIVTQKSDNKVENYDVPGVTKTWYSANTNNSSSRNTEYGQYKYKNDYTTANKFDNNEEIIIPDEHNSGVKDLKVVRLNDFPTKLKASNVDYTVKGKVPFDYKAKQAQYGKNNVNYEKYNKKTNMTGNLFSSITTASDIDVTENNVKQVVDNKKEETNHALEEKYIKHTDDKTEIQNDKILDQQTQFVEAVHPSATTEKALSAYDFLIHALNLDYNMEKIYE